MHSLFKQTKTRVHSDHARKRECLRGSAGSARASAAAQLGAQLLLWVTFYGYDLTSQTVWQAALALLLPLGLLWFLWRGADLELKRAKWFTLPLILCLFLDFVFALTALGGLITQLSPVFPLWVCVTAPAALCALTSLRAGKRGVWYGSAALAAPLVILVFFGTVFLRASTRADRLWPIWGDGWLTTAKGALTGAGSVWSAALFFLLPGERGSLKSAGWALTPWALCALWALWFGFVRPWAAGDTLVAAEKMMGLARHADSVLLYETAGLMWMLLLPAALTSGLSSAEKLLSHSFPRLPRWVALVALPIGAVVVTLACRRQIFALLQIILPWRCLISLICGLGLWSRRRA